MSRELCYFSYELNTIILFDDVTDKFKVSYPFERIYMFILQMPTCICLYVYTHEKSNFWQLAFSALVHNYEIMNCFAKIPFHGFLSSYFYIK